MDNKDISADFPRHQTGAVSGVNPKALARKVGDSYVDGWTEQELLERYDSCNDLVDQLVSYCQRKAAAHPEWSRDDIFDRTTQGLDKKLAQGLWDITAAERDWIIAQLVTRLPYHL